ncbi:hypothetical protein HAX54_027899 [Datura stramonium]|uniref:Uncharacterized protein n=1 Tax=Datura stramonium TaxID=4076 RepID=A0ABS8V4R2_DATST|nr:hypothetical protein [Datura stramonium]
MGCLKIFVTVVLVWALLIPNTHQLGSYETQVLSQLRKHRYPVQLGVWENYNGDFCKLGSTLDMSIICQDNSVTELKIKGDKLVKVNEFHGVAVPNNTYLSVSPLILLFTTLTRENHLDSELPPLPQGLTTILLSNNAFYGEIPEEFGKLNQLQHLDLSNNALTGRPPADLFSLPSISYLDLAFNVLSGSLPEHLNCGSELGFVDISDNRLLGAPSCLNASSDKQIVKGSFLQAAALGSQGAPSYRVFSMEELEEATNIFDKSALLGEGSIGKIYKGKLENGTCVALVFWVTALMVECKITQRYRLFLVYEFIPCGNFRARLSETTPGKVLKWSDRLAILIGVAKAVHFLHTGKSDTDDILSGKKEMKHNSCGKGETFLLNEMASFGSQDGGANCGSSCNLSSKSLCQLYYQSPTNAYLLSHRVAPRLRMSSGTYNMQLKCRLQQMQIKDLMQLHCHKVFMRSNCISSMPTHAAVSIGRQVIADFMILVEHKMVANLSLMFNLLVLVIFSLV